MQARNLNAQLTPVPRVRQGDMPQVEFHVEALVFHPVGAVQATGHLNQPGTKQGLVIQSPFEGCNQLFEAHFPARGGIRVVNSQAGDVLWRTAALQVDEGSVQNAELFHAGDSGSPMEWRKNDESVCPPLYH